MEFTATEAWSRILEHVRALLPDQTYRTWLEKTEPLALSQDRLAVGASSEFAAERIEDKYGKLLSDVAERLLGRPIAISFQHHVNGAAEGSALGRLEPLTERISPTPAPAPAPAPAPLPAPPSAPGGPLNDRYTFERFVVGTNNQLAAAAARAVSEAPARMYNPLFIYGGVGLGKTHLMHAIGHVILARDPTKR